MSISKKVDEIYLKYEKKRSESGKYIFEDSRNDSEVLCYILAGYKDYLWENVFNRIKESSKGIDVDICIVSSGKYSTALSDICKNNHWSYLSTEKNNICLIQNICLKLFANAKWIFKLDEDIFLTKNYFERMIDAYKYAEKGSYEIGIFAPLININSYGTGRILEKLGLTDYYENRFEKWHYGWGTDKAYYANSDVAKFMWGDSEIVPLIDELDRSFMEENTSYSACPVLLNIGAILFKRNTWDVVGPFRLGYINKNGLGRDEKIFNQTMLFYSKATIVTDNIAVGHFSFTPQNEEMMKYYNLNREKFVLPSI